VTVAVTACKKPAPPAMPPSEVAVITVAPQSVEDNLEFVGQVQAYRTVQVRAQATGVIMARTFTEGSDVHAGQVLYRIDPTIAEATWRSARGRLAEAQARLANSETTANRLRPLLAGNAVAKQDVDNAESQVAQARASVDDARGAVDAAKKALDDAVVRAEISGRVGRAMLDVGTRVTGSSDILTTIDILDPVYVSFRPSAEQQLAWRRSPALSRATMPGGSARIEATLPDGSTFPGIGRIGFINPVVDPQTGTQEYRAQFENVKHLLLPGQFVHIRVRGLVRDSAVVVPQRAVLQQMGRQIVYVVGHGDSVAAREVKATEWAGAGWLIESGLTAGDRVVVDGIQKIGPGAVVKVTQAVDSTAAGAPKPGAAKPAAATPAAATPNAVKPSVSKPTTTPDTARRSTR